METTSSPAPDGAALARLERIAVLRSREARPGELLAELRELLQTAELSTLRRHGEEVVERLRTAPHGT